MLKAHWLTNQELENLNLKAITCDNGTGWPEPIQKDQNGKFYFDDECWAYVFGPFETEKECRNALIEYAKTL